MDDELTESKPRVGMFSDLQCLNKSLPENNQYCNGSPGVELHWGGGGALQHYELISAGAEVQNPH